MEKKDGFNKYLMYGFLAFLIAFIPVSSWLFFTNNKNIELSINSDNEMVKEKTAVNEALTKALVIKTDSAKILKKNLERKDSVSNIKDKKIQETLNAVKKLQHENDSIKKILKKIKWSDLQPVKEDEGNSN